jgi:hypothetical protein
MTLLYKAFGEVGNNTLNSVNSLTGLYLAVKPSPLERVG